MMFRKLGLINKGQKGFTALEMLTAFAVTGIISGGITSTVFQVIVGSARTNNHMMAVRQAQNAGYFVSRDIQAAQSIIYDDPTTPGVTELLTLHWIDWSDTANTVRYTLEGTDLWRDCNGQRIPVAQCIDPAETGFYLYKCLIIKEGQICGEWFATLSGLEAHFAAKHPSEELEGNYYESGTFIFRVTAAVGSGSQEQRETKEYSIVSRAM